MNDREDLHGFLWMLLLVLVLGGGFVVFSMMTLAEEVADIIEVMEPQHPAIVQPVVPDYSHPGGM